jgi:4-amino-4-deoxy-L-arabinose transferase-like glycosyltransferase
MITKQRFFYLIGLGVILILGTWLRVKDLGALPYGLNRDEAAIAYNSWLLWQTGQDEWQRFWPLTLESFGDYKLPGYPYLLAGLWNFLPANDFWVRLPSALAGSGCIIIAFGLTWQLTKRSSAALLAAALIASSPIFIWYSRGAWEANLSLMLFLLSLWLVLVVAAKKFWRPWQLLLLLLLLLASFFTYNTPTLICLASLPFLGWFFWSSGYKFWLPLVLLTALAVGAALVLQLPVTAQKTGITIFTDATVHHNFLQWRQQLSPTLQPLLGREKIYWLQEMAVNTAASFSPQFWLHGGTHPWHQLPGAGHFDVLLAILVGVSLVAYVVQVLASAQARKWRVCLTAPALKYLVFLLLCLSPSIITTDAPHATRSLTFFFALLIGLAVSTTKFQLSLTLNRQRRDLSAGVLLGLTLIILALGAGYFARYRQVLARQNLYQGGLEQVLTPADELTLIVDSANRAYQYIRVAWGLRLPPSQFWSSLVREAPDVAGIKGVSDLESYHFYDDDLPWWDNWRVIIYNKQTQQWEKYYDQSN